MRFVPDRREESGGKIAARTLRSKSRSALFTRKLRSQSTGRVQEKLYTLFGLRLKTYWMPTVSTAASWLWLPDRGGGRAGAPGSWDRPP